MPQVLVRLAIVDESSSNQHKALASVGAFLRSRQAIAMHVVAIATPLYDYEFTHSGALAMLDRQGNCVSVGFSPDHIPAIEHLLTILYAYRGDYDDVMTPIVEPMAA
jgi:hypothetical protein